MSAPQAKTTSINPEKNLLIESMIKLIEHIYQNNDARDEIFASISQEDLEKLLENMEDSNAQLRKISCLFLCELLNDCHINQMKFCDQLSILPVKGKVCINQVPIGIIPFLSKNPQLLENFPTEDQSNEALCWFYSQMNASHNLGHPNYFYRSQNKIGAQKNVCQIADEFLDPKFNLIGFTIKYETITVQEPSLTSRKVSHATTLDHQSHDTSYDNWKRKLSTPNQNLDFNNKHVNPLKIRHSVDYSNQYLQTRKGTIQSARVKKPTNSIQLHSKPNNNSFHNNSNNSIQQQQPYYQNHYKINLVEDQRKQNQKAKTCYNKSGIVSGDSLQDQSSPVFGKNEQQQQQESMTSHKKSNTINNQYFQKGYSSIAKTQPNIDQIDESFINKKHIGSYSFQNNNNNNNQSKIVNQEIQGSGNKKAQKQVYASINISDYTNQNTYKQYQQQQKKQDDSLRVSQRYQPSMIPPSESSSKKGVIKSQAQIQQEKAVNGVYNINIQKAYYPTSKLNSKTVTPRTQPPQPQQNKENQNFTKSSIDNWNNYLQQKRKESIDIAKKIDVLQHKSSLSNASTTDHSYTMKSNQPSNSKISQNLGQIQFQQDQLKMNRSISPNSNLAYQNRKNNVNIYKNKFK